MEWQLDSAGREGAHLPILADQNQAPVLFGVALSRLFPLPANSDVAAHISKEHIRDVSDRARVHGFSQIVSSQKFVSEDAVADVGTSRYETPNENLHSSSSSFGGGYGLLVRSSSRLWC